jgi:hypothetical protein
MSAAMERKKSTGVDALRAGMLSLGLFVSVSVGAQPPQYYAEDIKEAMSVHIDSQVDDKGVFHLKDDRTGEPLALQFVKIHDPVRQIDGTTYFACTDFHVLGEPEKLYDIDFWLHPAGDKLEVYDTKVHKEPRRSVLYGWYKYPRYNFIDDKVVPLY